MKNSNKTFGDDFNRYMSTIRNIPLLSLEEERILSEIIMTSNDNIAVHNAINKLISSNLLLVVKFAIQYHKSISIGDFELSIMDLISEGNLGLLYAAKKFDHKKGRFSGYASHWIKRHLTRARLSNMMISVPINYINIIQAIVNLEKTKEKLEDSDFEDIALKNDCSVKLVHFIMQSNKNKVLSFDSVAPNEDICSLTYSDILASPESNYQEDYDNKETREYLIRKIGQLKPMEREIIKHRFLDKKGSLTCLQIADKMGISKQRVHAVLVLALKKLKKKINKEKLKI